MNRNERWNSNLAVFNDHQIQAKSWSTIQLAHGFHGIEPVRRCAACVCTRWNLLFLLSHPFEMCFACVWNPVREGKKKTKSRHKFDVEKKSTDPFLASPPLRMLDLKLKWKRKYCWLFAFGFAGLLCVVYVWCVFESISMVRTCTLATMDDTLFSVEHIFGRPIYPDLSIRNWKFEGPDDLGCMQLNCLCTLNSGARFYIFNARAASPSTWSSLSLKPWEQRLNYVPMHSKLLRHMKNLRTSIQLHIHMLRQGMCTSIRTFYVLISTEERKKIILQLGRMERDFSTLRPIRNAWEIASNMMYAVLNFGFEVRFVIIILYF